MEFPLLSCDINLTYVQITKAVTFVAENSVKLAVIQKGNFLGMLLLPYFNLLVFVVLFESTVDSISQILSRRLRFRLERAPAENTLIDRTGCCLKMEPLATVAALERYLLKMVR